MFNPHKWQKTPNKINEFSKVDTNNDIERLIELIESTCVDITDGYQNWMNVAFALINKFGSNAREYFHRISKFHRDYTSENCDKHFDSFFKSKGSGITIASLFWIAKQNNVVLKKGYSNLGEKNPLIQKTKLNDEKLMKFPLHVFPDVIADYVRQSAESINCPEDFIAVSMLSTFATAISNKRCAEVKKDWQELATLFICFISVPGTKKSAALKKALLPVKNLDNFFWEEGKREDKEYEKNIKEYEQELLKWKSLSKSERLNADIPEKPKMKYTEQLTVEDITTEALSVLLSKSKTGTLMEFDEFSSWVKGMNQYKSGQGNDLEYYLKLWGAKRIKIDRKGQKSIYVDDPVVNILGGTQPETLDLLYSKNNGFTDRILFSFPNEVQPWVTDDVVPLTLDNKLIAAFDRLYNKHSIQDNEVKKSVSPLTSEAYKTFTNYINYTLYPEMTSHLLPYYLRGIWSKMTGHIVRFALVIQGMNYGVGNKTLDKIDKDSVLKAIEIGKYFLEHARIVNGIIHSSKIDKKITTVESWINKNDKCASIREIYTYKVAGCRDSKEAQKLLQEMVDRGLGKIKEILPETGGRAKKIFVLEKKVCNPQDTQYNLN